MDNLQIRQLLREQISKVIKKQKNSSPDPNTTCVGRGYCCKSNKENKISDAIFKQDNNRRITCKCPEGYRKINCPLK
tara:strand:+ start:807 stop:1037 length:231 start_codon:yes stop_codon:yes gene_type:complete